MSAFLGSQIYFNSIKVQLELLNRKEDFEVNEFQFHKGTIRTFAPYKLYYRYCHFNSIKVQLELSSLISGIGSLLFQFHKGTIRTQNPMYSHSYQVPISIP